MAENSHYIQLGIYLNERLGIKSVTIDHNTTELSSDSELLKVISITILKSLSINKDSVLVQDLLNELDIHTQNLK